jgi:hypothetical protein
MTALNSPLALHLPVLVRTPLCACYEQRIDSTHRSHSNTLSKTAAAGSLNPQARNAHLLSTSHRTARLQIPIAQRLTLPRFHVHQTHAAFRLRSKSAGDR